MRDIQSIYDEYRIPPWLAKHMYRVAAVGACVFDARRAAGDALTDAGRDDLVSACLLHDLGNVIKFNFTVPLFPPAEEAHWRNVQAELIAKYGADEHHATLAMLDELHVRPRVRALVDAVGFEKNETTLHSGDMLKKMIAYADSRVVPNGVASLAERMADMYVRYSHKHTEGNTETERSVLALNGIEHELFQGLTLLPTEITESSVAETVKELKTFPIAQMQPLG